MRFERLDQLLAHIVVHLGEDVAVQQVRDRTRKVDAFLVPDQLEQVGDVGGVERLDQRARTLVVARLQRVEHGRNIFGLQPVVLVQLRIGRWIFRKTCLGFEFGEFGVADLGLPRSIMNAMSCL